MFDTAVHVDAIYATLAEPVTPAGGDPFLALFSVADVDAFDGATQAGDYTLRYQAGAAANLTAGTVLTIRGEQFVVAALPRRVGDGFEFVASLVDAVA
ncbi:hypothetical protein [Aromatoleum aromaticum]|uniref:hypothetical protein n=1 Tax=Aromatoleum aromaticum TaxID=551760 RepID=UPI001459D123|nr:hypothetical protein [Aromatoleum aromaticum]NMG56521.1 hypothetical protein [Aromatoleum aromaticum]